MPKLKESKFLTSHFKIHSMIDLSDGLASDIHRLAEESRVGARLFEEAIPISKFATNLKQALTDGEDFELLFTLSAKEATRVPFHRIGEIVNKKEGIRLVGKSGQSKILLEKGFNHFR